MPKKKTAAVIFSGGGIKGLAQIGALKAIEEHLEQHDLNLKTVVGTSVGSITASLLAAGIEAQKAIDLIESKRFLPLSIADVSLTGPGLIKGKGIHNLLSTHIKDTTFQDTETDLLINAVDLLSGHEYVYSKQGLRKKGTRTIVKERNRITDAVGASIAIPFIFQPRKEGKLLLADGGLLNPIALDLIEPHKYDEVIIVQTTGSLDYIKPDDPKKSQVFVQAVSVMHRRYFFPAFHEKLKKHRHIKLLKPPAKPLVRPSKTAIKESIDKAYAEAKEELKR